jgi:hypothetical protein
MPVEYRSTDFIPRVGWPYKNGLEICFSLQPDGLRKKEVKSRHKSRHFRVQEKFLQILNY